MMTRAQYETLGQFFEKFNEWDFTVERDGDDLLIHLHSGSIPKHYERFIDTDGNINRYDYDAGKYVPATIEPLKGSYTEKTAAGNSVQRNFQY